jgi:hypothetical protein
MKTVLTSDAYVLLQPTNQAGSLVPTPETLVGQIMII